MQSRMKQYQSGLRAGLPVFFGFVPVGIAYAIMARQAGMTTGQTVLMSLGVFAGASQIMAVGMIEQGASLMAIILATFILNLRHLIMSTCVQEKIRHEKLWMRLLAAFGVTDESFAIMTTREDGGKGSGIFFLGVITLTYSSWVLGGFLGCVLSDFLPPILTASFGIALYAMFIALVVPGMKKNARLALLVLITALCNTLLSTVMDSSWALIVSTLVCAGAGTFFVDLEEPEALPAEGEEAEEEELEREEDLDGIAAHGRDLSHELAALIIPHIP